MTNPKVRPLDNLDVFEIMQAIYPDQFAEDSDENWDAVMEMIDGIEINGDPLDMFLGRLIMLAPTMESPLTGKKYHVLGTQEENHFRAVAKVEAAT